MKSINCHPTWTGIMPAILAVLENGTQKGKDLARAELMDLARNMDEVIRLEGIKVKREDR